MDERYGSFIQFESKAGADSLHIVVPKPILATKILNEELPWPLPTDPTYGVIVDVNAPGNFQVVGNNNPAGPCCKEVTIEYDDANTTVDSCFVTCEASGQNEGSITCRAGCRFDFAILWEWNPQPLNTSWVILSKFTIQDIDGECEEGPGNTNVFIPAVGAKATRTKHFKEQGVEHPYAGATGDHQSDRRAKRSSRYFNEVRRRECSRGRSGGQTRLPCWIETTQLRLEPHSIKGFHAEEQKIHGQPDSWATANSGLSHTTNAQVRITMDEYKCVGTLVGCPNCDKIITRAPAVVQLP